MSARYDYDVVILGAAPVDWPLRFAQPSMARAWR